jgi:uncharacterized membrane protein YeaQ/YmgE (transglycosylase-associated protein family)
MQPRRNNSRSKRQHAKKTSAELVVGTFRPSLRGEEEGRMHILWSLIVGLVVGALAKLFMPGKDPGGVIITMLLGIAGSLVAGFVGRSLGWYSSGSSGAGIIASIIGAMALLGIYRLLLRRRHTTV